MGTIRAFILDNGNVIAWRDSVETHEGLRRKMGLTDKELIPIYIYLRRGAVKGIEASGYSMGMLGYDEETQDRLARKMEANPYLLELKPRGIHAEGKKHMSIIDELKKVIDERFVVSHLRCPKCKIDLVTNPIPIKLPLKTGTVERDIDITSCPKCGFIGDVETGE